MHWIRQPIWWPSIALAMIVAAGLVVLAAEPDAEPGVIAIFAADERPIPLPVATDPPTMVDLNRASEAELRALPGIGETRAEAIIGARANRPFRDLGDLVEREVVPASVAEALRGLAGAKP
jgi:DNA uptake protein ComE-like DNA-binding protein